VTPEEQAAEDARLADEQENAPEAPAGPDPRDVTITELTNTVTALNGAISAKDVELQGVRAANAALLLAVPGTTAAGEPTDDPGEPDEPDIEDLFGKDE